MLSSAAHVVDRAVLVELHANKDDNKAIALTITLTISLWTGFVDFKGAVQSSATTKVAKGIGQPPRLNGSPNLSTLSNLCLGQGSC